MSIQITPIDLLIIQNVAVILGRKPEITVEEAHQLALDIVEIHFKHLQDKQSPIAIAEPKLYAMPQMSKRDSVPSK